MALPKSRQKARRLARCPAALLRGGVPCASRRRRGRLIARPCANSRRARIVRAPLRAISAVACDARHRDGAGIHEAGHPWPTPRSSEANELLCFALLLLRQDAAKPGAPYGAASRRRKSPQGWRAGCAPVRCSYTDVRSANPAAGSRTRRAGEGKDARGRATQEQLPDARRARHLGGVSLVTLFAQALRRRSGANSGAGPEGAEGRMPGVKKVTRSSAGGAEALLCS